MHINIGGGGIGLWAFFSFMYMFTSHDVNPMDKTEFLWRFFAGPLNFLPI